MENELLEETEIPIEEHEGTALRLIFGNHPEVKIIDTLVSHKNSEYTLTDLSECSEVSRTSLFKLKDKLLHYGIMQPARKVGRITLYKFNKDSPTGKLLNKFVYELAEIDIEILVKDWEDDGGSKEKAIEKEAD